MVQCLDDAPFGAVSTTPFEVQAIMNMLDLLNSDVQSNAYGDLQDADPLTHINPDEQSAQGTVSQVLTKKQQSTAKAMETKRQKKYVREQAIKKRLDTMEEKKKQEAPPTPAPVVPTHGLSPAGKTRSKASKQVAEHLAQLQELQKQAIIRDQTISFYSKPTKATIQADHPMSETHKKEFGSRNKKDQTKNDLVEFLYDKGYLPKVL